MDQILGMTREQKRDLLVQFFQELEELEYAYLLDELKLQEIAEQQDCDDQPVAGYTSIVIGPDPLSVTLRG